MDLDGDGKLDLISGSYDPGDVWLFSGRGKGELAEGKPIRDEAGVQLVHHPEQLVEYQTKYEKTDQKTSRPALDARVASFGSWPAAVDWDGDGDLDIVIGSFSGAVFLRKNVGSATKPVFAKECTPVPADGKPMQVHAHAAPAAADWDGDGRWDLVVGADDGAVVWFANRGTKEAPELGPAQPLLPALAPEKFLVQYLKPGEEPGRGVRNQVCVTDYDGDGKLDLLVGDYSSVRRQRDGLGKEDLAALAAIAAEERGLDAAKDQKRIAELAKKKAGFYEDLGVQSFVWVYLRR